MPSAIVKLSVPDVVCIAVDMPVKFDPSIAGNAPVRLAAVKPVRLAPDIAGNAPVIFAAGILVKLAADP